MTKKKDQTRTGCSSSKWFIIRIKEKILIKTPDIRLRMNEPGTISVAPIDRPLNEFIK